MHILTVSEIEDAINFWLKREGTARKDGSIGIEARVLADIYGLMIYNKETTVSSDSFNRTQLAAIQTFKDEEK